MHRLLQGEVGSGKTVVALTALLMAVQGGHQGAFMAPTEVLAEQHDLTCATLLDGLDRRRAEGTLLGERPVRVDAAHEPDRAPPSAGGSPRACAAARSTSSSARTRSSTTSVEFARLGVAVVDEQHRFGVEQRDLLRAKGGSERSSPTCS